MKHQTETIHEDITADLLMEAAENDSCTGFCTACGTEHSGIEPDAEDYECESCGQHRVCGAEQLLLLGKYN